MKNIFEKRLQALVDAGTRARAEATEDFVDSCGSLSTEKKNAWASFLCSIATTESIETMLIDPIRKAFAGSKAIVAYLDAHADDERRHYDLLTAYVKRTFAFEKTHRSTTDVIVYGFLLPKFSTLGQKKPLYLLTPLRFYEAFSLEFYNILKVLAVADELPQLVSLIQSIEKDELRHLAGLDALVREYRESSGVPSAGDLLLINSVLKLLLFDINIAPWAVHNRRVRRNALAIGINPDKMGRDARGAAAEALRFARGLR